MVESNRAARRRAAKAAAKDMMTVPPENAAIDITLADVNRVLAENPMFRQAVVNAALQRQLVEARTKLAVYEAVADGSAAVGPPAPPDPDACVAE